jgi:heat-inducible transcriptional repressor
MNELDERTQKILWAIIQSHIDLNTPVGSSMVTKRLSFGLSPATVRNIMAGLEELGYVMQPHTSAGRVPTKRGYRYYVDSLLKDCSLKINKVAVHRLYKRLRSFEKDLNRLFKETSRTLSLFSRYLSIVTPPRLEERTLKNIRLIKYDRNKALSIMISEDGIVNDKVIDLGTKYSQRHLDKLANYLNSNFSGLTFIEVRSRIIDQLSREEIVCDRLIARALKICKDIIVLENDNILMEGLTGACNLPDFADMEEIREILKAIEDKHLMLKLFNQVGDYEGVQVFVGLENIIPSMKKLSMVVSTYNDRMDARGTIGIIGPTRMNYKKLIPIVDQTAKTLTQVLTGS